MRYIVAAFLFAAARAGSAETEPRFAVPDTVSPEAAKALRAIYAVRAGPPSPDAVAAFVAHNRTMIAALGVTMVDDRIGGVNVVRVRPSIARGPVWTLIYLHGGGYNSGSAKAPNALPALIADRTGAEVIAIDYTLAPHADWNGMTREVVMVWRALLAKGMDPRAAAIFGDSAGGSLAAGVTLRLRDAGVPLPAALYLVSPWSDISGRGDTYATLSAEDPLLASSTLGAAADAYSKPDDRRLPYVSPVYGDYTKPFPPSLIQCGTREMFVSNCVRLYQAIRAHGREAILDMYEGMPHAFPGYIPETPETRTAVARAAAFFGAHLLRRP